MIAGLVAQLQDFDAEEEEKGLFGFFKKQVNKAAALKAKYDKAEVSVDKICGSLEQHQVQLMKDMAMLDKMYELNLTYYKELSMYILAGKKRLEGGPPGGSGPGCGQSPGQRTGGGRPGGPGSGQSVQPV